MYSTRKKEFKYNANGYVSSLKTSTHETYTIEEYEYDDVVKNYLIKTTYHNDSDDVPTNNHETGNETKIYRNSVGNIVKYERYYYHAFGYDNDMVSDDIPKWYVTIEYDENNIARNIKKYGRSTIPLIEYSDIEWFCTNGQILIDLVSYRLTDDNVIMNPTYTSFESGLGYFVTSFDMDNLIKSATVKNYNPNEEINTLLIEIEYPDLHGSYIWNVSYNGILLTRSEYSILDAVGSYSSKTHYYKSYDKYKKEFASYNGVYAENYKMDPFGLLLAFNRYSWGILEDEEEFEIYYNDDNIPVKYGSKANLAEYTIFSDFAHTFSSVKRPEVENINTKYYTLQGIPAKKDCLAPGIYIKITGDKREKIIIK